MIILSILVLCLPNTYDSLTHLYTQLTVRTNISAKIPQGLKVTLSKRLYEQILETMRLVRLKVPKRRVASC